MSWGLAGRLFSGNGAAKIGRTPDVAGPAGGFAGGGRNPWVSPVNRSVGSYEAWQCPLAATDAPNGSIRGRDMKKEHHESNQEGAGR